MPSPAPVPPRVAVVGGGIAGLSLTRELARRGARVELLDAAASLGADRPVDAGASSLPVALLNPWRGRKGAAHPDDLRGLAATWRWARGLEAEGLAPGAHRGGVLRVPTDARQARGWRERASSEAAETLEWLAPQAVPEPYHAPLGAVRVTDGGWVEPRRWLAALAASARAHGATLRTGVRVGAVAREGGAWRVADASGAEAATAEVVVMCIGAAGVPDLRDAGAAVPTPGLESSRGEIVALAGGPALPHPVAGGVYGGTAADGSTWVGGGHRPADVEDPQVPARLRSAFARVVPALAEAPVAATWSGVRARATSGRPLVGALAPGLWWFGAFAGRGFLCAADRAERLAAELLHPA